MAAYGYRAIDRELTESVFARRASLSNLAAAVLSEKFDRLVDIGVALATRVKVRELVEEGKWVDASKVLSSVPGDFPFVDRITLHDLRGTLMADVPVSPEVRGRNFAERDWYQAVMRTGEPYVSQVYRRAAPPRVNVFVAAVPIKSSAGAMLGILVVQVRSDWLFEWVKDINVGPVGFVYVVDRRGMLAAHPKYPPQADLVDYSSEPAVQRLLEGKRGVEIEFNPVEKEERVVAYEPVAKHGWGVVIAQPTAAAFAARDEQLQRVLGAYGVFLLFAAAVAYLFSRIAVQQRRAKDDSGIRAELQRYVGRLEALLDMDKAILEAQSARAVARAGLQHLRRLMPYSGATVRVFDHAAKDAAALISESAPDSQYGADDHLPFDHYGLHDLDELKQGRVCVVPDVTALAERAPVIETLRQRGMRSYVRIPLMVEGTLVGALNLWSDETAHFTLAQIEIARAIADQLAIALQHAILREQIEGQATELERRVTERTVQLEATNKELESFSYSVSHDLRSPLRAISGYTRMLEEDHGASLGEEGQRYLSVVQKEAGRMAALIDDLLAFSRLGREQIKAATIDMTALARDVVEELRPTAAAGADIDVEQLPPGLGDRTLLRQVWVNLIANAIKYSGKREQPRVRISGTQEPGETVYRVEDNGAGFDMRHYNKLFGVFQRLHGFDEFPGTGIGLAIVQRVVTRHGGRVWGEGEPDRGATFYFSLPG